jgi:HD superfamily phosphohydrolase
LAGLLHDIGHGPYSHLFDSKVVTKVDGADWSHELASLYLIDAIYDEVLEGKTDVQKEWLEDTKDRVKALIIGKITKAKYVPAPQCHKGN